MHVFGAHSPAAAKRATASYRTKEASALVRQDVLLLAGAEDHYVPNTMLCGRDGYFALAME
jgi:hypothetical protein